MCMISYSFLYSFTWSLVYPMCQKWRSTKNTNPIPNHLSSNKSFILWFWGWLPGPWGRWARIPPLTCSIPSATSGNGGVNFAPEDHSLQFKIIHWDFSFLAFSWHTKIYFILSNKKISFTRAGNVAHLVECSPSMQEAWGLISSTTYTGGGVGGVHTCRFKTFEGQRQGDQTLKFIFCYKWIRLGYTRPYLKKRKENQCDSVSIKRPRWFTNNELAQWRMPESPALGKEKEEDQKFKVMLDYLVSLGPGNPASKQINGEVQRQEAKICLFYRIHSVHRKFQLFHINGRYKGHLWM